MADESAGGRTGEHTENRPTEGNATAAASHVQGSARRTAADLGMEREGPSLATAALVGLGVAIIEPELIPGMLIGAGALLAPKLLPGLGNALRPMVKGVVKAGYAAGMKLRETMAEAGENVEDMMAEARAEYHGASGNGAPAEPHNAGEAERRARQTKRGPTPPANPNPNPATKL